MKKFILTLLLLAGMAGEPLMAGPLPGVLDGTLLNEPQQQEARQLLRGKISKKLTPAKNDYVDDLNRGTVFFTEALNKDGTPLNRNYARHKVIVSDGTVIRECNFVQRVPKTKAIQGENLTFVSCNLVNNEIDPTWTLIDCLVCEHDFSKDVEVVE